MIAISLLIGLTIYIVFASFAIRMAGTLARFCAFSITTARVLQIICAVVFLLLPTWDIIPSRLYFKHLCEHQAGVRVLKTVKIDKSYLKQDGKPDDKRLLGDYTQFSKHDPNFSSWAHITKIEGGIEVKQTSELLGTVTDFVYYGGWLGARLDPNSPITCPSYKDGIFGMALRQIFKPKQPVLPKGK